VSRCGCKKDDSQLRGMRSKIRNGEQGKKRRETMWNEERGKKKTLWRDRKEKVGRRKELR